MASDVPTSAISFVETNHGRMRRHQRCISKKDLKSAKKYGSKRWSHPRPNGDPTAIYTHNNITYITNERTGEEVTSYANPIPLDPVPITPEMQKEHTKAVSEIQQDKTKWKSNTVIVVDTSGSMKKADVWCSRTRLDAVWLSVSLDFIADRMESGEAGSLDVVSIITLSVSSEPIILEQPTTWVLYNKIVDIYTQKYVTPYGHGNYIPSLDEAENLLTRNSNASCAMGLLFISDGRPSDAVSLKESVDFGREIIRERVALLAKRFGRRLQFDAVGIGSADDFDTLQEMVDVADDYGAKAALKLPSNSSSSLGEAFQSFSTSMTSTQTEMTSLETMTQQTVKQVNRESRVKASKRIARISNEDFHIYPEYRSKRLVYEEYQEENGHRKTTFKEASLRHPSAAYTALNKEVFGEGGERFAYRFYEIASDGKTIVGKPLVAKESRFIVDGDITNEDNRRKFVETFCKTQQLAGRIAEKFNKKMDSLNRVDKLTPRVSFLDCCVYRLDDVNIGELSVLVEEKLDHTKWKKWNANNGYVEGMKKAPELKGDELQEAMEKLNSLELGIIEEDEEDEEDDETESDEDQVPEQQTSVVFSPSEVAQAFSCFSFWASFRKRLVCDLQGVFDEEENMLRLSDPAIHYYNHKKEYKKMVYGKTDRGRKGIAMFKESHECNHLCHLVSGGFRRALRKRHKGKQRGAL